MTHSLLDVREIVVLDLNDRREGCDLFLVLARIPYQLVILIFVAAHIILKRVTGTLIHLLEINLVGVFGNLDVLVLLVSPAYFEQINKTFINFASTVNHMVDLVDIIVLFAI